MTDELESSTALVFQNFVSSQLVDREWIELNECNALSYMYTIGSRNHLCIHEVECTAALLFQILRLNHKYPFYCAR